RLLLRQHLRERRDQNDPIYPFLCEHGWRGIAVEPLEPIFAQLERNYHRFPRVARERAAVAPEPRPFYYIPTTAGYERTWTRQVGALDPGFLPRTIDLMRTYQFEGPVPAELERSIARIEVPCLTFAALMEKHRVKRVDFINIDAEGSTTRSSRRSTSRAGTRRCSDSRPPT